MERNNSSYKERGSEASMADSLGIKDAELKKAAKVRISKMPIQMELDLLKWIKCIHGQVPV